MTESILLFRYARCTVKLSTQQCLPACKITTNSGQTLLLLMTTIEPSQCYEVVADPELQPVCRHS